jgi:hypothetical protein
MCNYIKTRLLKQAYKPIVPHLHVRDWLIASYYNNVANNLCARDATIRIAIYWFGILGKKK